MTLLLILILGRVVCLGLLLWPSWRSSFLHFWEASWLLLCRLLWWLRCWFLIVTSAICCCRLRWAWAILDRLVREALRIGILHECRCWSIATLLHRCSLIWTDSISVALRLIVSSALSIALVWIGNTLMVFTSWSTIGLISYDLALRRVISTITMSSRCWLLGRACLMVRRRRLLSRTSLVVRGTVRAFLLVKHTGIQIAECWMATKGVLTHLRGLVRSIIPGVCCVGDAILWLGLARLFWVVCLRLATVHLIIVMGTVTMLWHFHWVFHLMVSCRHRSLWLIHVTRLSVNEGVVWAKPTTCRRSARIRTSKILCTVSSRCLFWSRCTWHMWVHIPACPIRITCLVWISICALIILPTIVRITVCGWMAPPSMQWRASGILTSFSSCAWALRRLIRRASPVTVSASTTGVFVGLASWTSRHVGHLSRCRLNVVNVLLESVGYLCWVLLALTVGTNSVSSMADLAGRLMRGCLVMQALFRRSLWRSTCIISAVNLRIISSVTTVVTIWASLCLALTRVASLGASTLIEMLLISRTGISWSSPRPTVLITDTFIRCCCVMVACSIALGTSCHVRSLRGASLDFICSEFFKISDARLKTFNALALTNITIRALVMVTIYATIWSSTCSTTRRLAKVAIWIIVSGGGMPTWRCEICRLMVLRVIHFSLLILQYF